MSKITHRHKRFSEDIHYVRSAEAYCGYKVTIETSLADAWAKFGIVYGKGTCDECEKAYGLHLLANLT